MNAENSVPVVVSFGEYVDRLEILRIKSAKLGGTSTRMFDEWRSHFPGIDTILETRHAITVNSLRATHERLWELESKARDEIRNIYERLAVYSRITELNTFRHELKAALDNNQGEPKSY